MSLELVAVFLYYDDVSALKGLSLHVDQHETVALIGSNGAGKSSTLKVISWLSAPASGRISFEGKRIDGLFPHEIVRCGIVQVPEGRRVFPYMSIHENLKMGAFLRKDKHQTKKDYEIIYSHFPALLARKGQSAGTLSGGEQQMLAIGRALMAKPKLLLLDEPSLGLSPLMCREITRILTAISRRLMISMVLVEQNARMAFKLANRGYVLETGRITLQGTKEELTNNPEVKRAYLGI